MQGQRSGDDDNSPIRNSPPRGKRISQKGARLAVGKVTTLPVPPRSNRNSAFVKSRVISHPLPIKERASGRAARILPSRTIENTFPLPPVKRTSTDLLLSWLQNNMKSVTDDERIFILAAKSFGTRTAIRLAVRFQWRCGRVKHYALAASSSRNSHT